MPDDPFWRRKLGSATASRKREIASRRSDSLKSGRRRIEIRAESELGTIAENRAFGTQPEKRWSQITDETKPGSVSRGGPVRPYSSARAPACSLKRNSTSWAAANAARCCSTAESPARFAWLAAWSAACCERARTLCVCSE